MENCNTTDSINISDPVEKAISKHKIHPSILLINDKIENQAKFSFKPILQIRNQQRFAY